MPYTKGFIFTYNVTSFNVLTAKHIPPFNELIDMKAKIKLAFSTVIIAAVILSSVLFGYS
jgi:hypothetical protein